MAKSYPELALRMKEARELAGFPTQEKLARTAEIALSTLQKWERGSAAPTFRQMEKLMPALGRYGVLILFAMGLSAEQIVNMGRIADMSRSRNRASPPAEKASG